MDKHKSLDFGMDAAAIGKSGKKAKKGQKGQQEMADANAEQRRLQRDLHRGQMSMDMDLAMDMSNPYILPPEIHNSRESLHSLSRTVVHGAHDPYRPATFAPSLKGSQFGDDASSIRTGSTHQTNGFGRDGMNQNLLRNAQRMSRSGPPPPVRSPDSMSEIHSQTSSPPLPAKSLARGQMRNMSDGSAAPISELPKSPESAHSQPPRVASPQSYELPRVASPQSHEPPRRTSSNQQPINQQPQHVQQPSNNYYYQGPAPMGMSLDGQNMRPHQMGSPPRQKGLAEIAAQEFSTNGQNPAEFKEIVVPPPPNAMSRSPQGQNGHLSPEIQGGSTPFFTPTEQYDNQQSYYEDTPYQQDSHYQQQQQQQQQHQGFDNGIVHGLGVTDADFDTRRLSIMRPLPPDDPSDNAEQRANRIRSFYKEYFSDDQPAKAYVPNNAEYYEDYGSEYLGDGTIFDPETGRFVVAGAPYAEPVTRRAMTPPPRGPPRFRGNAGHMHTGSAGPMSPGSPMGPGPRSRAFSSASTSRMGPSPRGAPRKNLPPPQALRTVPTPHLLKEGDFMLPIDFAPPSGFKERLQGRPNSPLGVMRPYSPSVAVANPLASSYNDLPSMPSP